MFFLCRLMERKSFFYANYLNWSLTSPVMYLISLHEISRFSRLRQMLEQSIDRGVIKFLMEEMRRENGKKSYRSRKVQRS